MGVDQPGDDDPSMKDLLGAVVAQRRRFAYRGHHPIFDQHRAAGHPARGAHSVGDHETSHRRCSGRCEATSPMQVGVNRR